MGFICGIKLKLLGKSAENLSKASWLRQQSALCVRVCLGGALRDFQYYD